MLTIRTFGTHVLPRPVAAAIARFIAERNLTVVLDRRLVKDIMEYHGIGYEEAIDLIRNGQRLNAELWKEMAPQTAEEIVEFYRKTPYNIFDCAWWNMLRRQRRFRQRVLGSCIGKDVLDYGGGIGIMSSELARKGFNVTLLDVEGKTLDFARWLFAKRGLDIRIKVAGKDLLESYDDIVCLDVLEHLPDAEKSLGEIVAHLRDGGRLLATGLECEGEDETHPMHRQTRLVEFLEQKGLRRIDDLCWSK
jgi:2-polyprenyl-3-methyl-5-hydroxy-6-metoxy-1,4-benzoquinol methylase